MNKFEDFLKEGKKIQIKRKTSVGGRLLLYKKDERMDN